MADKDPLGTDDKFINTIDRGTPGIGNRNVRVVDPLTGKTTVLSGIPKTTEIPAYTAEQAKRWGTNKDVNVAYWQNFLFQAGYYKQGEIPALGLSWSQTDVDAMTRAMTDANLGGLAVEELLNTRVAAVQAGVRPMFHGSSKFATGGSGSGGGGGVSSTSTISLTSKYNARLDLRKNMLQMIGRVPTADEYNEYLSKLNANEKKYYKTVTQSAGRQTVTGSTFDAETFTTNFILNRADFKTDALGQVGEFQDAVNQLVRDNGLDSYLDNKLKVKYTKQLAKGELSVNDLRNELRDRAGNIYTAFSDKLKSNQEYNLRDAAAEYIRTYANMFELDEDTIDLKDALSKATTTTPDGKSATLNVFDYEKSLRKDERYKMTNRAKQEAAGLGKAFARAMGVNL